MFLDTNPIIYFLGNISPFAIKVRQFILNAKVSNVKLCTSTITDAEFIVKPLSEQQFDKISLYNRFLDSLSVYKRSIDERVATRSAEIRAKYKGIKLADALQLAAAIETGCDTFLTNDKQLKQVSEINVVLLEDL